MPPHDGSAGYHGTAAAIEFAVLNLNVTRIIVCGHSHCGGIRALYEGAPAQAKNLIAWLELGREAVLPVQISPEALRHTEQRAVEVLQLERLMGYPMVREHVEADRLTLHGWHYVIEDGEVHVFDVRSGAFVAASMAEHSGTGPYAPWVEKPSDEIDAGGDRVCDALPMRRHIVDLLYIRAQRSGGGPVQPPDLLRNFPRGTRLARRCMFQTSCS